MNEFLMFAFNYLCANVMESTDTVILFALCMIVTFFIGASIIKNH